MSHKLLMAAVGLFCIGILLFFVSDKKRQAEGEWSNGLQWAYLLMMVGVFGVLSFFLSFTAVLLIFVLFTCLVWLWDRYVKRQVRQTIDAKPFDSTLRNRDRAMQQLYDQKAGHFVDYMSGFFPIILVVFVLRTFIAEPFQIPSSSMRPGLVVGDFILVNKFAYGIRMPISNQVVIPVKSIGRGDVAVFNYPEKPSVNYIKRIVGLPGDVIEYRDKNLSINGTPVESLKMGTASYLEQTDIGPVDVVGTLYQERVGKHLFQTLRMAERPSVIPQGVRDFANKNQCAYEGEEGFKCTVPAGQYFAMGDNRDNSEDSRYWGFVDDKLIVGKAFLVWMNFRDFSRIGTSID